MSYQWLYASASVTGPSHHSDNTPCQDACHISVSLDGTWTAIAVCDGAGSALHSKSGADLVAKSFSKKLLELSAQFSSRIPGAWVNDFVIQQVLDVRSEIRKLANSDVIDDYHSTLVACLLGPDGGFSIHIGDGALFGGSGNGTSNNGHVYLDNNCFVSNPENGEYANETFFITEGDWIKHLRIIPLPRADWLIIGSDGGCALCFDSAYQPKPEFIGPLITQLSQIPCDRWPLHLQESLSDSRADFLTSDDKTLVVCIRDTMLSEKGVTFRYSNPKKSNKSEVTKNVIHTNKNEKKTVSLQVGNVNSNSRLKSGVEEDNGNNNENDKKNNFSLRKIIAIAALLGLLVALLIIGGVKYWPSMQSKVTSILNEAASSKAQSEADYPVYETSPSSPPSIESRNKGEKSLPKPKDSGVSGNRV